MEEQKNLFDLLEEAITGEKPEAVNHVVFIMDHSGSMSNIRKESMDNFNDQIKKIKEETEGIKTLITVVEFDNEIKTRHLDTYLENVAELNGYWTGGLTALYDAIGLTISKFEKNEYIKDLSKDHSVLFIIITDGGENASQEFKREPGRIMIKEKIEKLEKQGNWTFTFLGANIDVEATAVTGFSMGAGNTMSFDATSKGVNDAKHTMNTAISNYYTSRKMGVKSVKSFYEDEGEKEYVVEKTPEVIMADLAEIQDKVKSAMEKDEEKSVWSVKDTAPAQDELVKLLKMMKETEKKGK